MPYTLGQAAKATGKSKTAIAQALAEGRMSGIKDEQGRWQIDPAELHRVYPKLDGQVDERGHQIRQPDTSTVEVERLKAAVEGLERLCRQIENERDSLRERLDRSEQERRDKDRQLTALLTDQRPDQPAIAKRRWWLFGRG
jgi:chromosome segregation ATPase